MQNLLKQALSDDHGKRSVAPHLELGRLDMPRLMSSGCNGCWEGTAPVKDGQNLRHH